MTVFPVLLLSGCASVSLWKSEEGAKLPTPAAAQLSSSQQAEIHVALGISAERAGDPEKAKEAYARVLQIDDSRVDAYHRLALVHDKQGNGERARELYVKALELSPEIAEIHCDLAYNNYLHGRWDEAESGLRRAIELKPDLARAHNNLALLLARSGRADEALFEFGQAGASASQARVNLAFAMLMDGHIANAEQQLDMVTTQDYAGSYQKVSQMREVIERSRTRQAAIPERLSSAGEIGSTRRL